MDKFCNLSGQKVNISKFKIYISPNIVDSIGVQMSCQFVILLTNDLGIHLGTPLLYGITKQTYGFVVDKARKKLSGWK